MFISEWVIVVQTGEHGHNSDVRIKLHGDIGTSGFVTLDDKRNRFETNTWVYIIIADDQPVTTRS